MFNLSDMIAFYAVVNNKSFSAAAKKLYLSQSTISMRIKYLEDEAGVQLLVRNKSKVELTYAGEVFYKYVEKLLALNKEIIEALSLVKGGVKGTFTIAVPSIVSGWILPHILRRIYNGYPNVEIVYQTCFSSEILSKVANGEATFGIIRTDEPDFADDRFEHRLLERDRVYFAAKHTNSIFRFDNICLKDVAKSPLIVYGSDPSHWPYLKKIFDSVNLTPKDVIHLNDLGAVKKLAELGTHICCLSEAAICDEVNNNTLRIVPIDDYTPVYRHSTLIYRKGMEFVGVAKEFLNLVESLGMLDYHMPTNA